MRVIKTNLLAIVAYLVPANPIEEQSWHISIIQNIIQPSSMTGKELKYFIIINGDIYFRGSTVEVKENCSVHDLSYGDSDISLLGAYRGICITELRWPRMLLTYEVVVRGSKNP